MPRGCAASSADFDGQWLLDRNSRAERDVLRNRHLPAAEGGEIRIAESETPGTTACAHGRPHDTPALDLKSHELERQGELEIEDQRAEQPRLAAHLDLRMLAGRE